MEPRVEVKVANARPLLNPGKPLIAPPAVSAMFPVLDVAVNACVEIVPPIEMLPTAVRFVAV
jgi:hypothetical protein